MPKTYTLTGPPLTVELDKLFGGYHELPIRGIAALADGIHVQYGDGDELVFVPRPPSEMPPGLSGEPLAVFEEAVTDWPKTADDIAYALQGTCDSLHGVLEQHGMEGAEDDFDFTARLDALVFECEQCSWWFEISEMCDEHDTWKCEDCCHGG